MANPTQRDQVFISYSHKDRKILVTRDKEEKLLREALIRQRAAEIVELALSDPFYGVSREEPSGGRANSMAEGL